MSSDLATNQISLLNSHPNPAHRKYERFARTIRIGLKYLSTSFQKYEGCKTYEMAAAAAASSKKKSRHTLFR